MSYKEEILSLREELHAHNYRYYVLNAPQISDFEFDQLMYKLQQLEAEHPDMFDVNSPSQRVGSDINTVFQQVEHQYPMLSLANTYSEGDVAEFYNRVAKDIHQPFEIVCELKFDGTSISLIYENGSLVQAVTRGDGVKGDDVTTNVRTISSIPLKLFGDYPQRFEIRGEILLPWQSFNALNEERSQRGEQLFANPRNAASGTLKLQNSAEVAQRKLDAYLYYLLGEQLPADNHYDNMQKAAQWGFKVSDAMKICRSLDEVIDFINYWDNERHNLPVATDGMVLKVNSLSQQKQLGYTAKSPRWAIAYKFQAEKALTRLNAVTYQVGRTGVITPVANLDPVQLSGTIVKRATLHNADIIKSLDLHIGDVVSVEKGGEIIPKITEVDLSQRPKDAIAVEFPTHCPECGAPLKRVDNEAAHYCTNDVSCPPQIKGKIEHFVARKAMNIDGLGSEIIALLYSNGLIHNVADLYKLTVPQLAALERLGDKSARNIIASIHNSLQVPFERVLFAIGIRYVGETVAKTLAHAFGSLQAIEQATLEELMAVPEIGESIAQSVVDYFSDLRHIQLIDELRSAGLQFVAEQQEHLSNSLEGAQLVISGVFQHHSREEYKRLIEQHGGKNVSSISAKTTFVLAGENMGPAKLAKAESLGVTIMNENDFLAMIGEK